MPAPRLLLGYSLLALGLASLAVGALAGDIYKWTDSKGNTRYEDRGSSTTQFPAGVEQTLSSSLAEMQVVRVGQGSEIYVSNRLGGPLEVNVALIGAMDVQATPSLPVRQLLPPQQRVLISRVEAGDNKFPGYSVSVVPGDPMAIPADVVYSLPLDENAAWETGQTFHGGFSHNDEQNRFAVDLIVPEGTPVLAARDGVVMQVESGFDRAGLNRKEYAERANLVRILHDDGTMAVYAHLKENGVFVQVGDRVGVGEQIALSGNTGYSSGPHLHFCLQVNTGMRVVSIPFRMVTSRGFLALPKR